MAEEIVDPFHRDIYAWIAFAMDKKMGEVANGVPETLSAYREEVGYMRALNDVLDACSSISKERFGTPLRREE